jgi:Lipocalin-like domain
MRDFSARGMGKGRRSMRAAGVCLVTGLVLLAGGLRAGAAAAQTRSLTDQVVGTWALVSFDSFNAAGAKVPSMEGTDIKGLLVLTRDGRLSVQIISAFPKLASKDRLKTSAAEEKAVAHGVLSFFGTYTVSEAKKRINFRIERSSYPNQVTGKDAPRDLTLVGDEMRFDNAGRTAGGNVAIVWKRLGPAPP